MEDQQHEKTETKLNSALQKLVSDEVREVNQALQELQSLLETPLHRAIVSDKAQIPHIVQSLKVNVNNKAALKSLYHLANYSDHNKMAIVNAGGIRIITKQLYRCEGVEDAVNLLLELSKNAEIAKKIGESKDCITLSVSLLLSLNANVSEQSKRLIRNLSSDPNSVVKMAEAGYFQPFLSQFLQGSSEARVSMAGALAKMQLNEDNAQALSNKHFLRGLVQVLSTGSLSPLLCIKKLSTFPKLANLLLTISPTIPTILNLISSLRTTPDSKQAAVEALATLVEATTHLPEAKPNPQLQQLHSSHNLSLLLGLVASPNCQTRAQSLRLLLGLASRSETLTELLQSGPNFSLLFYSLNRLETRHYALELVNCVTEHNLEGKIDLLDPIKEQGINALVTIFTSSTDKEGRSMAAAVIARVAQDDPTIGEMLQKYGALRTIHQVICTTTSPSETPQLLENSLAMLTHFPIGTDTSSHICELEMLPMLVRVLSTGSLLAKERAALRLAQLATSSPINIDNKVQPWGPTQLTKVLTNMGGWCCSPLTPRRRHSTCSVHGEPCLTKKQFCLIRAGALRPLVGAMHETKSGTHEAALVALSSILCEEEVSLVKAVDAIVESEGVPGLVAILERGDSGAKNKALDILLMILKHSEVARARHFPKSQGVLIQLLQEDDVLKKKAAEVLGEMGVIPHESSYFG
ncbi:putative U-box domain-containing protein 42 [Amborella trichopoda]|uniref:Armadillo repeat-containing domain-containing protein n=1 Tax=Amborella trichopoda TaxID=13333 RepID=W1PF44_AMBTC|nr:putative U-box domain-containing protein 42 [Amborella trichopoda]ERN06339.1 hypothetical protein AMTR_s00016p00240730 [Amborella trichopoda]|eukprot:XP_006844664.1 putative U-box domain-containing protein 42 [Amborella trichopoda]